MTGLAKLPVAQRWMLGVITLGIPVSAVGALYPSNTWLQVGPVALLLPLTIAALRRWPISNPAAACVTLFVLLHLIAARWSYSFVPYHDWFRAVGLGGPTPHSGFERNMFDRLVHFAFGLLAVLPFCEIAVRHGQITRRQALSGALLFVLAVGGLYEIFEWSLTMTLAPTDAGAYNGEQGDMFDSQKDMAIAAVGALLAIPVQMRLWRRG